MLLVGGSGFLGLNWQHYNTIYDISATYNSFLPNLKTDWIQFSYNGSNINELEKIICTTKPKVIVNCAAVTNVDQCESNRSLSHSINTNLPKELAILANKISCKFIKILSFPLTHTKFQKNCIKNKETISISKILAKFGFIL